jgi:hypothetical protein
VFVAVGLALVCWFVCLLVLVSFDYKLLRGGSYLLLFSLGRDCIILNSSRRFELFYDTPSVFLKQLKPWTWFSLRSRQRKYFLGLLTIVQSTVEVGIF